MRIRKSAGEITKRIKERIYQGEFMERHRTSAKHFTRKRKLPFASLILFMLNLIKRTLQNELTQFIQKFSAKYDSITKSAFSQSRLKLKPEAFIELNDVLIEEFYTDNDLLNELIIDANIRCSVSGLLSAFVDRTYVRFLNSFSLLVKILFVKINACWGLPTKHFLLSPVVVPLVKFPELFSEIA